MRARLSALSVAHLALLIFSITPTCLATVLTFDDLSVPVSGSLLTNGYQSLNWTNFAALNAALDLTIDGVSGYYNGMVSPSNVAYNAFALPAEIDARGTNFNFLSAYLTGAWRSNLNIEVEGFNGASLVYSQVVVAGASVPTLFTFNYLNIDRLAFDSFGGQYAGFGSTGANFVMDNFTLEFVPEPSTIMLAALGALTLWPVLKRKRV